MRWLIICLAVIFVSFTWSGSSSAGVLVSPVVVDTNVQIDDVLEISVTELEGVRQTLQLDVALFDHNSTGQVVFLEDSNSCTLARQIVELPIKTLELEAYATDSIPVRILTDDFESAYVVMFIRFHSSPIGARLAVLLMLSTQGAEEQVQVQTVDLHNEQALVTFYNSGNRHGQFQGNLYHYDALGNYLAEIPLESGQVFPGRGRQQKITLSPPEGWLSLLPQHIIP